MRKLLSYSEFVLAVLAICVAIVWYLEDHKTDAALGVVVAVLALLPLVRRKIYEEPEEKSLRKAEADFRERQEADSKRLYDKLVEANEKLRLLTQSASAAAATSTAVAQPAASTPSPDYSRAIDLGGQVTRLLKDYATVKGADATGTPTDILDRLNISKTLKDGMRNYLQVVADLGHQPAPMIDWAADSGQTYLGILNMLNENAKKK
jgi:hypothetical protein